MKHQSKITTYFQTSNETARSNRNVTVAVDNRCSKNLIHEVPCQEKVENRNEEFENFSYLPIYYGNVRSIPAKTDFRARVSSSVYKVFCFTETWLNKNDYDDSYFPNGFNVYRLDRKTNGGGVAIIVHESFKSRQIVQIFNPGCESICVRIELRPRPIILYLAYVNEPKIAVLMKHHELVQQLIALDNDARIVVLGDFNLRGIKWGLDETEIFYLPQGVVSHDQSQYFQAALMFLQEMHQLPMYQLVNIRNIASNVLDLVFVNGTEDIQVCGAEVAITKITETDIFHPPIEISFEYENGKTHSTDEEVIEVFAYNRGNYDRMTERFNSINFAQIFDKMDVETSFDYFYELINGVVTENIPTVRKKKTNKPKWWTVELQKKKNKRDKEYKRKPKDKQTPEYIAALKEFNELEEKLYNEYISNVQDDIVENPAEFWRYAKIKQKKSKYPIEMCDDGKTCDEPEDIVNLFADYFEGLYVNDGSSEKASLFEEIYANEPVNPHEINLSMFDIERAISRLKVKGSAGPDNLAPIVIKKCADIGLAIMDSASENV